LKYGLEIQSIDPIYQDVDNYRHKGKIFRGVNVYYTINHKLHTMHGEYLIEQEEQPEKMSVNQIQERVKFELHKLFN